MVTVSITWTKLSPGKKPTIAEALRAKLGREPTHKELCDDVRRILEEATVDLASAGKLPHQRRRRVA